MEGVKSLKDYYSSYKFKNVVPEKLVYSFEKVCEQNLSSFFSSWIDGKVVIR